VFGPTLPASTAAAMVTGLNTDPGSYGEKMAALLNRRWSFTWEKSFGS
jgi:hypothetical protein